MQLIGLVVLSEQDCCRPAHLLTQRRWTPEQSLSNDVDDMPIDDEAWDCWRWGSWQADCRLLGLKAWTTQTDSILVYNCLCHFYQVLASWEAEWCMLPLSLQALSHWTLTDWWSSSGMDWCHLHSLSSHVGHGSTADCLGGIRCISCVTSSQLHASNFVNWYPGPCVKLGSGEPSVPWRISTTFFVKKDINSSAKCSCCADVRFLPIRWFTVVQSLRKSHLKDSILFVQNEWLFLAKYLCIFLTLKVHDALSDGALDVRYRFSRWRVSLLRARQSSSIHGSDQVRCVTLSLSEQDDPGCKQCWSRAL